MAGTGQEGDAEDRFWVGSRVVRKDRAHTDTCICTFLNQGVRVLMRFMRLPAWSKLIAPGAPGKGTGFPGLVTGSTAAPAHTPPTSTLTCAQPHMPACSLGSSQSLGNILLFTWGVLPPPPKPPSHGFDPLWVVSAQGQLHLCWLRSLVHRGQMTVFMSLNPEPGAPPLPLWQHRGTDSLIHHPNGEHHVPGPCRETQQCPRHTLLPLHSPHSSHTGLLPVPRMHWACSQSGPLHRLCSLPGPPFPQHSQGSFPTSIRYCSNATLSRGPSGTSICYCTAPTLSGPCLLAFKSVSASVVYHPSSLQGLVGRDLCLICCRPWRDSSGDIPRPCPPEAQKACHKSSRRTILEAERGIMGSSYSGPGWILGESRDSHTRGSQGTAPLQRGQAWERF